MELVDMTILIIFLCIVIWLALGYIAGRAAMWDVNSPGLAVVITFLGPIGLMIALCVAPSYFGSSSMQRVGNIVRRFYGA
jgi:hypothetical protein